MLIDFEYDNKTLIIKDIFSTIDNKYLYDECINMVRCLLQEIVESDRYTDIDLVDFINDNIYPDIVEQEKLIFEYGMEDALISLNYQYGNESIDMENINEKLCYIIFVTLMMDDLIEIQDYLDNNGLRQYEDVRKIKLYTKEDKMDVFKAY